MKHAKIKAILFIMFIISGLMLLNGCSSSKLCDEEFTYPKYSLGHAINSKFDDFAPFILNNKLFFTSNRGEKSSDYINTKNNYGEQLFISKIESKILTQSISYPTKIRNYFNEGTPAFSSNEKFVIFAHSYGENNIGGSDLYTANFNGSDFYEFKNLGTIVNSKYWDSQPCLSTDGNTLVFASDRPGGFGGSDLYKCTFENGTWSAPVNLGSNINTPGNELSPFITYDNKLLFSSDKPGGNGNLDIYFTDTLSAEGWTNPKDLAAPFNSKENDAFPCLAKESKTIYFASDRTGGCGGYDIYAAACPICIEPKPPKGDIYFTGTIYDQNTGKPILTESEITITEKSTNKIIAKIQTQPPHSTYKQQVIPLEEGETYSISFTAKGYYLTKPKETAVIWKPSVQELVVDESLKPIPPEIVINLTSATIPFFVTGYYRLNVQENLGELKRLLIEDTRFKNITYIDKIHKNPDLFSMYQNYADSVVQMFADSIKYPLISVLPQFLKYAKENEYLTIEITGYADPRRISGKYVEDDIMIGELFVKKNVPMTNEVLSLLRAYYSKVYVDKILDESSPEYKELKKNNKIKYIILGKGVDEKSGVKFDARRRVQIKVQTSKN